MGGGKLYDSVKDGMETTGMLDKSVEVCDAARKRGAKIMLVPIIFKADGSDNPNKNIGILKGCQMASCLPKEHGMPRSVTRWLQRRGILSWRARGAWMHSQAQTLKSFWLKTKSRQLLWVVS